MEIVLVLLGLILCLVGIAGSILPVLPGLPVSWLGLLILYFIPGIEMDFWFLGISFVVMVLLYALGYFIPAEGTKRFGGSKAGAIGTTLGLVIGLFFPFGILIGPFVGALLGELIFNKTNSKTALRAAFGSFIGFLAGTFINIMATIVFLGLFLYKVWVYRDVIF